MEFDPGLQRVIAYLHDDTRLTAAATGALSERLAGRLPGPMAVDSLVRWRLAEPLDAAAPHRATTAWRIDPAVVRAITGVWRDPAIEAAVEVVGPDAVTDLACLHAGALEMLRGAGDLTEVELVGPPGIGRQTLAAQFAAETGRPLVAADLPAFGALGLEPREAIVRVLRLARATGRPGLFPRRRGRASRRVDAGAGPGDAVPARRARRLGRAAAHRPGAADPRASPCPCGAA